MLPRFRREIQVWEILTGNIRRNWIYVDWTWMQACEDSSQAGGVRNPHRDRGIEGSVALLAFRPI